MATFPARLVLATLVLGAGLGAHAQQPLPFSRSTPPPAQRVGGLWRGVDLEQRSNCTNTQNDGNHGTYAQFQVGIDTAGAFTIDQTSVTGLTCAWRGTYTAADGGVLDVTGTYQCSDGKQGTFATRGMTVTARVLTIQLAIQLTDTETCTVDGLLSMAKYAP